MLPDPVILKVLELSFTLNLALKKFTKVRVSNIFVLSCLKKILNNLGLFIIYI